MNHSTDSPYQELERQMMQQQAETHALASGMMDDPRRLQTMPSPNALRAPNPARPTAPIAPPSRYLASTVSSRARRSPTPQSIQTRQLSQRRPSPHAEQRPRQSLHHSRPIQNDPRLMPPPPLVQAPRQPANGPHLSAPGRVFSSSKPALMRPSPKAQSSVTEPKPKPKEVPDWLPKPQERTIAPGVIADYDSLLLTNPQEVHSWQVKCRFDDTQIMYLLQYFEQVSQLKGQGRIRTILEKRKEALRKDDLSAVDELDPIAQFKENHGVPIKGFVLRERAEGDRPKFDDDVSLGHRAQQTLKKKQGGGGQISGFIKTHDPVPIGTTLTELVRDFPSHLQWELLDPFIQQHITSCQVETAIVDTPMQTTLEAAGYWKTKSTKVDNREGFLHNRFRSRRNRFVAKYGVEAAHAYLNSPFKLRELGEGLIPSNSQPLFSDIRYYVAAKTQRVKEKEQNELEAEQAAQKRQDTEQQREPLPRPPLTTARNDELHSLASVSAVKDRNGPVNAGVEAAELSNSRPQFVPREGPRTFIERLRRFDIDIQLPSEQINKEAMSLGVSVASTEQNPFGEVAGHSFWDSRAEYLDHIRTIGEINETNKGLARHIIDHDKTTAHLKRSEKTRKVEELLASLLGVLQSKRYKDLDQGSRGGDSSEYYISQQLELEIKHHLQRGTIGLHNLQFPRSEGVHRLKSTAIRQHAQLHRLQTYVLAGVAESVVRGERSPINSIRLTHNFKWVEDLEHIHASAMAAACVGTPNLQDRLTHHEPLKLAIAYEIEVGIRSKHGHQLSDLQYLKALKQEAKDYRRPVAAPRYVGADGIGLSPGLREEALAILDDITEQAESDLLRMRKGAEERDSVLGRRGRDADDENSDDSGDEDLRPAKIRREMQGQMLLQADTPQEHADELEQFKKTGIRQAPEESAQIPAENGSAADNIPPTRSKPTPAQTKKDSDLLRKAVHGAKRKASEAADPDGNADSQTKKTKINAANQTTLILQEDGTFAEQLDAPGVPSSFPSTSTTAAQEQTDYNQLFGNGANCLEMWQDGTWAKWDIRGG